MKSLYKLLGSLFIVMNGAFINAQSFRIIDLGNNMVTPDSGYQFVSPDSMNFKLIVTNYGPDTVWALDSIIVQTNINDNDPELQHHIIPLNNDIIPGDSIEINFKLWCDVYEFTHFLYVRTSVALYNRNPLYNFEREVVPVSLNNVSRTHIQNRNRLNFLELDGAKNQQHLFPNPTSREFDLLINNLKPDVHIAKFSLFNSVGQEYPLDFMQTEMGYHFVLPENIPGGTYFLKGLVDHQVVNHKILVQ